MTPVLVYVTSASRDEALRIGRALVEERLAACANIYGEIRSIYRWEGQVQDDAEIVVILKTRAGLVERLSDRIRALHSYDCPCVVAVPITGGNPEFLAWIGAETGLTA
jgi:periplasmic divalent cation tolerance protein